MDLNIIEEKDEPVFKRTRISADVTFNGQIPSRGTVAQAIADAKSAKVDQVSIREVSPRYGEQRANVVAYVYETAEALNSTELKHVVARTEKTLQKEAPAEEASEAPAEAPAAEEAPEAPAEESSEEASEEASEESADEEKSE